MRKDDLPGIGDAKLQFDHFGSTPDDLAGISADEVDTQNGAFIMKELYGIDMEKSQYSKLIDKIPTPDIVISMGCDVGCPYIGRPFDDNWGLPDPTGQSDDVFRDVIRQIEENIRAL